MVMIQPLFTSSKWNMGENFGLKFPTSYVHTSRSFFFEIPSWGQMVIFVTEFIVL